MVPDGTDSHSFCSSDDEQDSDGTTARVGRVDSPEALRSLDDPAPPHSTQDTDRRLSDIIGHGDDNARTSEEHAERRQCDGRQYDEDADDWSDISSDSDIFHASVCCEKS